MRSRTGTADSDPLAPQILCFFDIGPRVESKVELLIKIGNADKVRAAETGVIEMSRTNDRRIDLPGDKRGHGQGIARHQNELHVQTMLFEQTELARNPYSIHAFSVDARRQV